MLTELITDIEIYEKVIQGIIPNAKKFVWIGTADIKDLYKDFDKYPVVPTSQVPVWEPKAQETGIF